MTIGILGAGPHGRQIAALQSQNVVFYDDCLYGYENVRVGASRHPWLIGAAWPKVRRQIAEKVPVSPPWQRGVVLYPGCHVGTGVELGEHVHAQFGSVISHGCMIGDFVTICPGAVLSGEVTVEDDVFIGANATIIHGGITIGTGAVIGAGAVVIDDVPPGAVVAGVPAKKVR